MSPPCRSTLIVDLEAAFDGPLDLVTISALLDLVSDEWLQRLVVEIAVRHLPVYAALSYDGRIGLYAVRSADKKIVAAVNADQRTDKGFGPALGPGAAQAAAEQLERIGYVVTRVYRTGCLPRMTVTCRSRC